MRHMRLNKHKHAPKNDCTVSEMNEVVIVEEDKEIVDVDKHRSFRS